MSTIPEPPDGIIAGWYDPNDDLFAVFFRTDQHLDDAEDTNRWYSADQLHGYSEARTWEELLDEMNGFRGPVELVSNGRIRPGHRFAGDEDPAVLREDGEQR